MGLKVLMFVYPTVALTIGILSIYKYPLYGKRLVQVKEELVELHEQKKSRS